MMQIADIDESMRLSTPYKSVNHALRDVYMTAVKVPYKTPSLVPASPSFEPKSWDDFAGDAGMIMRTVKETLTDHQQVIINALYIIPETGHLETIKNLCCSMLANEIAEYHPADQSFLIYTIKSWAGYNYKLTLDWWAEQLNVNEKTLRRWRHGWCTARGKENGIMPILDTRLHTARGILAPEFRMKGWIE